MKNKKKALGLAAAGCALCLGLYAVAGNIAGDETTNDEIPLHDGDVLVDSLSVQEDGASDADGSALVTSDDVSEMENTDAYFQERRATLDIERNKIISMLTDAEGSASTQAEKQKASEEKMRLLEYMEQEKTIETLIVNKGLPVCFLVITDSGVDVTVNTDDLDQPTVTKICELIMRQTGRPASEIVVQEAS